MAPFKTPLSTAPGLALALTLGQHSDRGVKAVQQDFHGACLPDSLGQRAGKGAVVALADGIGSSQVSQVASQAAVFAVLNDYYSTSDAWTVKRSMQRVLAATNSWLHAQTQRGPYRHDHERGYVCALSVLVLKGRSAHLFHSGDTRIYRLQGAALEQLTEDHRVWVGGGQSYLSRALGFQAQLDIDYRMWPIEVGDTFVLASDGAYEHLPTTAYAAALHQHGDDLDAAARALVAQALAAGSTDNLTLQLVRVDALPPSDAAEAQRLRAGLQPPPVLHPRSELDGYRIERELHTTHRSRIYLATDTRNGQTVVIKTPATELQTDEASLDRFIMEEWIARRISSAHVLKAHPQISPRSALYVVMELVPGCTLAQWQRDHPAPDLATVRAIVEQIARGLQAFHRLEMLHQDLRPENIMIDSTGTVKIIDFGAVRVAGLAEANGRSLAGEQALGTLSYMAPECFLGDPASERSDLFSLGVITYELLTGRLPYGTEVSRVRSRADQNRLSYIRAASDDPRVPAWIDDVLAKAVHPQPLKRHEALSEFVQDLRQPGALQRQARVAPLVARHPALLWQLLCAVLAIVVLVLAGMLHASSSPATAAISLFTLPESKSI